MKKARVLNKMISRQSSFTKRRSKKRAATARIQITRLLEKLECFEIILFNAFAFAIQAKALNKMISRHSSFTKRRVV
jgi:hypothetical protein